MTTYSSAQVVTIKELRIGDTMHCGITAGKCMVWRVVDKDSTYVYVKVGGSMVKMTGRDIRGGLPMYRASQCPTCETLEHGMTTKPAIREDVTFTTQRLDSADIPSVLSRVDNVRRKNTTGQGGAAITSRTKYLEARTATIIDQLLKGAHHNGKGSAEAT